MTSTDMRDATEDIRLLRIRAHNARAAAATQHRTLKLSTAHVELRIIAAAGGDKHLGGNAEARSRALLVAEASDAEYQAAVQAALVAEEAGREAVMLLEVALDRRESIKWQIRLDWIATVGGEPLS